MAHPALSLPGTVFGPLDVMVVEREPAGITLMKVFPAAARCRLTCTLEHDDGTRTDGEINGPVAVDYPVPQPDRLLPGHVWELVFDLSGELPGGLAEHGEVPQQGVAALTVGVQLAELGREGRRR
jgi:hypothetical protein